MQTQRITESTEKEQPESFGTDPMGWTWQIAAPVPVSPEQIRREAAKYGRTRAPIEPPVALSVRSLAERRAA